MTNYSILNQIIANLPEGSAHPLTSKDLAERLGVSSRVLMEQITYLVMVLGVPIGASRQYPYGYYIITDEIERMNAVRPLRAQAREMEQHANRLETMDLDGWRDAFKQ